MKKEILFVLLKDFADWEGAYIAPNLNAGVEPGSESKYIVKTVSVRKEPVVSIVGFKVLPDYGIHFLNHVSHTSNGLDYLKQFAGVNYTGENLYMDEPAVRAGNIITANGFATLEFCREILYALEADSSQKIERSYRMNKTGVWEDPEVG